jgi:adenylate cyclase
MPDGAGGRAMSETRKIAAILVADVVGYSRLTGADEDRILARMRSLRSDLIDPTIAVHHGRVFKRTGDGAIVEFRSVVDAVNCAIEIQRAMVERNAEVAADKRIEFRVGIHLGDVVEESDGDLMGDGVNIAARLEGIATPGSICLSEDAYRQVKGRLNLKVADLGATQLKNIADPIRVYSLEVGQPSDAKPSPSALATVKPSAPTTTWVSRWPALAVLTALLLLAAGGWYMLGGHMTKPAQAAHLSIVVFPFANLSGDPAQDYFADGITENLTTDLSRLSGSFVIARNTAFAFKGKNADAREIGKELGVRYVLEGSVQRDQNQVRVNAQLIDAETGGHLWAERFDKPLADLFSMQDEIVASLASQLGAELVTNEARRAERTPAPDSMDLYFQGMAWYNKGRNPADIDRARGFFERALALDPDNLDAAVGKAAADIQVAISYSVDDKAERLKSVEVNLNRVLSQSPNNAGVHFLMGRTLAQTNRQAQGIEELNRALTLNPNLASAHAVIGVAKLYAGHPEETESNVREALHASPRDPDAYVWVGGMMALAKLHLGAYEDALNLFRRSIELNRNYATGRFYLAATLVELDRLDEAKSEVKAALALNPNFTLRRYRDATQSDNPVFLKGRERIIEDMRKAGVPEG